MVCYDSERLEAKATTTQHSAIVKINNSSTDVNVPVMKAIQWLKLLLIFGLHLSEVFFLSQLSKHKCHLVEKCGTV